MMDFHILIVISCVFLASLFSWLFINKFFRRKTFDEIIAEKKALSDKLNAQSKATAKKPKKLQLSKKDQKRERKQQQRLKDSKNKDANDHDDSDTQSEKPSVEDESPVGLSKTHVEFDPDPEILNENTHQQQQQQRRQSNSEKEVPAPKQKSKKDKKAGGNKNPGAQTNPGGILVNKNEPIAIKANTQVEETLNNFEAKHPKDMLELKRAEKERKEENASPQPQQQTKKDKHGNKKEKSAAIAIANAIEQNAEIPHIVTKEIKQSEEKVRQASPKNHHHNATHNNNNASHNKNTQKQKKQGNKDSAATREIVQALDKLSDSDTIGVSLLMNLFKRAELNRSEIQILIDYLLNKQQDMPASLSEWSDDMCQKLKRQLEEKERALAEEQEASIGIQAKLRELRTEINSERAHMNATIKAYTEKLQSKDQELAAVNQEIQAINEKFNIERQQFQAKLLREKQAGSQDLLTQLQLMQNELAHKDKCINDLTCLYNASRQAVEELQQKNDIIQSQLQQLEQQREELEQVSNSRIFELEKLKEIETENAEIKIELRNLQNAFESAKVDLTQSRQELDVVNSQLALTRNVELAEKQQQIQALQAQNAELTQQLSLMASKREEQQSKEHSGMQATLDALRIELGEKEKQLTEFVSKNTELLQQHAANSQKYGQQQQELQQRIETLNADVASKHQQLQDVERVHEEKFTNREKELLQQLQEQKEKNNDLRMKNWKLVEALQNAETTAKTTTMLKTTNKQNANLVQQEQQFHAANSTMTAQSIKDEKHFRDLLQRLCPEAVKACAGSALSLPVDQWIEQVLATHIKQSVASSNSTTTTTSSSNKSNINNSNHSSSHNSHNNNNNSNSVISESATRASDSSSRTTNNGSSGNNNFAVSDLADLQKLQTENAQLRARIDELTRLVTKTSNTLSELECHAREQDENWRSIVRSKDEQIHALQHSNGEQDI